MPRAKIHFILFQECLRTLLFFKILFIYLFVRESEHKQGEWQAEQAEGEAGSPLSKEPKAGLYPRTLGSPLELKADA